MKTELPLAQIMRVVREAAGLTQAELAQRFRALGYRMTQPRVSNYERGKHEPSARVYVLWLRICAQRGRGPAQGS